MPGPKLENTCLIVRPDNASRGQRASDGPRLKLAHDKPPKGDHALGEKERTLLSALRRRGLDLDLVDGSPQAMVALARQTANLMIVIDPINQPRLDQLLDAVRRYYPQTTCWAYHLNTDHLASTQPRLERLARPELHENHAEDQPDDQNVKPSNASEDASNQQPLVSEQEVAMLLGE